MGLTQYLEYQEDQDMIRLLNFLKLKRGEKRGVFLCLEMKDREVYIVVIEEI